MSIEKTLPLGQLVQLVGRDLTLVFAGNGYKEVKWAMVAVEDGNPDVHVVGWPTFNDQKVVIEQAHRMMTTKEPVERIYLGSPENG